MSQTTTLHDIQTQAGAEFIGYGPDDRAVYIAQGFGQYEAEYASIRQRVGIMHMPHKAVLRLTGDDRKDFLHRMLTQEINALKGGASVRAFQINQKGRVVADIIVHHGDADTWLEMDRFDLPAVKEMYESYLFADDVVLEDWTSERTLVCLHGPSSIQLLQSVTDEDAQPVADMPGTHHVLTINNVRVSVYRWDTCGVPGFGLWIPEGNCADIYQTLLSAAGYELDAPDPSTDPEAAADFAQKRRASLRGRPIGWEAFNTARIEAGSPIFHIDFGEDSIPAETALLDEVVSFTKGCYLGQEIVARMKSLGHPKRLLVGLKVEGDGLPIAGSQVAELVEQAKPNQSETGSTQQVIGGVTSSAFSPLLGHAVVFAVMKWGKHTPGTEVLVAIEGNLVKAQVCELRFLPLTKS